MKTEGIFKFEPIVDVSMRVWGYEVLLNLPDVPNGIIFSVPNPALELHLLKVLMKYASDGRLPSSERFTFNLSPMAFMLGMEQVEESMEFFPKLYIEITECPFWATDMRNWFRKTSHLFEKFSKRFLIDDLFRRKGDRQLCCMIEKHIFAVKLDYDTLVSLKNLPRLPLIVEHIKNIDRLQTAFENGALLFQGELFWHREELYNTKIRVSSEEILFFSVNEELPRLGGGGNGTC